MLYPIHTFTQLLFKFILYTFFFSADTTKTKRKEHYVMSNSKDTSSKKQGKSSVTDNNVSNKNVTHTDHRSKTASNGASSYAFDNPSGEGPDPRITSNKAPSSGNIRGV
jgi:hypothetical protein